MSDFYGGIEAGGTKFVCVIGSGAGEVLCEERFPTTTPDETIQHTIAFFETKQKKFGIRLRGIGLGSFGPIDLYKGSKAYGYITTTPKPGWKQTNIVSRIQEALKVPVMFDTDVNAAAMGEGKWGAGKDLSNFIYFTIGTGIGGGAIVNGKPIHGLIHPEMGHFMIPRNPLDTYPGKCPFHTNCFEGLASGPAIGQRWDIAADLLPPDHPAWELEAEYIAKAMSVTICMLSPQRIILGGGVMQQLQLFPKIRERTNSYLNGYIHSEIILNHMEDYIVPPVLGNQAGMLGAIAMAQLAG
jgi:fructokinase